MIAKPLIAILLFLVGLIIPLFAGPPQIAPPEEALLPTLVALVGHPHSAALNLWGYCGGDPVNRSDTTGLAWHSVRDGIWEWHDDGDGPAPPKDGNGYLLPEGADQWFGGLDGVAKYAFSGSQEDFRTWFASAHPDPASPQPNAPGRSWIVQDPTDGSTRTFTDPIEASRYILAGNARIAGDNANTRAGNARAAALTGFRVRGASDDVWLETQANWDSQVQLSKLGLAGLYYGPAGGVEGIGLQLAHGAAEIKAGVAAGETLGAAKAGDGVLNAPHLVSGPAFRGAAIRDQAIGIGEKTYQEAVELMGRGNVFVPKGNVDYVQVAADLAAVSQKEIAVFRKGDQYGFISGSYTNVDVGRIKGAQLFAHVHPSGELGLSAEDVSGLILRNKQGLVPTDAQGRIIHTVIGPSGHAVTMALDPITGKAVGVGLVLP